MRLRCGWIVNDHFITQKHAESVFLDLLRSNWAETFRAEICDRFEPVFTQILLSSRKSMTSEK